MKTMCKSCQKPVTSKGDYRHCEKCGWFKVEHGLWKPVLEMKPEMLDACVTGKDPGSPGSAQPGDPAAAILAEKQTLPPDPAENSNSTVTQEEYIELAGVVAEAIGGKVVVGDDGVFAIDASHLKRKSGRAVAILGLLAVICAGIAIFGKRILCLIKKSEPENTDRKPFPKLSEE